MKKYRIEYRGEASDDLDQIFAYISEELENLVSAQKMIGWITTKCDSLAIFPRIGAVRSVVRGKELRTLRAKRYTIIYCVEGDTVVIFRILYARRDLREILG